MLRLALATVVFSIAMSAMNAESEPAVSRLTQGCKTISEVDTLSLDLLRKISTHTHPMYAEMRDSLGLPASAQASEVVFVTDSATCALARAAFDSVIGDSQPNRVVAVFKVKTIVAVTDTALILEGWHVMMYFSPQWALLSQSQWP